MERPSWAPVLFWGALPKELSDALAISILALVSLEAAFSEPQLFSTPSSWVLVMLVPLTSALAALSASSKRLREELALYAYGGSPLQIQGRHILRGGMIVTIGLLPLIVRLFTTAWLPSPLILLIVLILGGGLVYAIPGIHRTRSLDFVEQYKG